MKRFDEFIASSRKYPVTMVQSFADIHCEMIALSHQFTKTLRQGTLKNKIPISSTKIMLGLIRCFPADIHVPVPFPFVKKAEYSWLDIHNFESHVNANAQQLKNQIDYDNFSVIFMLWFCKRIVRSAAGHLYWRAKAQQKNIINNYDIFGTVVPHTKYNAAYGYDMAIYFALHNLLDGKDHDEPIRPDTGDDDKDPDYSTESDSYSRNDTAGADETQDSVADLSMYIFI